MGCTSSKPIEDSPGSSTAKTSNLPASGAKSTSTRAASAGLPPRNEPTLESSRQLVDPASTVAGTSTPTPARRSSTRLPRPPGVPTAPNQVSFEGPVGAVNPSLGGTSHGIPDVPSTVHPIPAHLPSSNTNIPLPTPPPTPTRKPSNIPSQPHPISNPPSSNDFSRKEASPSNARAGSSQTLPRAPLPPPSNPITSQPPPRSTDKAASASTRNVGSSSQPTAPESSGGSSSTPTSEGVRSDTRQTPTQADDISEKSMRDHTLPLRFTRKFGSSSNLPGDGSNTGAAQDESKNASRGKGKQAEKDEGAMYRIAEETTRDKGKRPDLPRNPPSNSGTNTGQRVTDTTVRPDAYGRKDGGPGRQNERQEEPALGVVIAPRRSVGDARPSQETSRGEGRDGKRVGGDSSTVNRADISKQSQTRTSNDTARPRISPSTPTHRPADREEPTMVPSISQSTAPVVGTSQRMDEEKPDTVPDLTDLIEREPKSPYQTNYSAVHMGSYQGMAVAIKVLNRVGSNRSVQRRFYRESEVWWRLRHSTILPLLGYAEYPGEFGTQMALISPWCERGNAAEYLQRHRKPPVSLSLWQDVAEGVDFLHNFDPVVVHGDLKPMNVLVGDDGRAKLCDFGLVRLLDSKDESLADLNSTSVYTGTRRYKAAELWDESSTPTIPGDIYALGCIGLYFVYGLNPYEGVKEHNIFGQMNKGIPPAQRPRGSKEDFYVSWLWKTFRDCWNPDPRKRPTARQVYNSLLSETTHLVSALESDY